MAAALDRKRDRPSQGRVCPLVTGEDAEVQEGSAAPVVARGRNISAPTAEAMSWNANTDAELELTRREQPDAGAWGAASGNRS